MKMDPGKMKRNRQSFIFSIILLISQAGWSVILSIGHNGDTTRAVIDLFSEELYMRTDRDLYATGEKVWFSVYKLNTSVQLPDSVSKVVYVDLLDLENNPVSQLKIGMNSFTGSGSLILPDTLRSGNYLLCSYTNWMKNFSPEQYSYKTIAVINPFERISNFRIPGKSQLPDSVSFYPEAGNIIAGLPSKTGFRAITRNGNPVIVQGSIADDAGDTLCRIHSGLNGYGLAFFKPQAGRKYFLIASDGALNRKFPLPVVISGGSDIVRDNNNNSTGELAQIRFSNDFSGDGKDLILGIYSQGLNPLKKTLKAGSNSIIRLTGEELPYGLIHLVLTDAKGDRLTDRWLYNRKNDAVQIKVQQLPEDPSERGLVRLNISTGDEKGRPLICNLSVSVIKAVTSIDTSPVMDCSTQLPSAAPVIADCNLKDINDFLIFYRPHSNETPLSTGSWPKYLPELEGHLISGNIRERSTGAPLRNENLTLSIVGKSALCSFTRTDSSGNFNFVTKGRGTKEIVIQPLNLRQDCYVDLSSGNNSRVTDYNHGVFCIDTSKLDEINNLLISMQINNIYEPFIGKKSDAEKGKLEKNFYGEPDNSVDMSRYIQLTSVKEIITELMPGVSTVRSGGKVNFRMTKPDQTKPFENPPIVLVDGVPVYDLDKVIAISSGDIERVDVLINRYFIYGNVIDGIIHFITKKGNLSSMETDKAVFRMEYDLLRKPDMFYSPDYSQDSIRKNHLPDFRNTLYWNPSIHPDKTGNCIAEFYTSDEAGKYIITIEGVTENGAFIKSSRTIFVKPAGKK